MNEKWFELSTDQIEKKLKTNAASGLSRKAARSRARKDTGSVFLLPSKSPLRLLGDLVSDFALILLFFVALVSLFFEEYRNGAVVLTLLLSHVVLSWILYYRSTRTTESLAAFFYPTARVIRGGKPFSVDFRSVVPGDVLLVDTGDVVCCDARLVTSDHLKVRMRVDKENYLPLEKMAAAFVREGEHRAHEMGNMLHAGSVVTEGSGRAIVTAVGKYTYIGAMTGGVTLPMGRTIPKAVANMRKTASGINMIFLLAVLPLSLIGLLFSTMNGGTILLSSAFLTALSLAASTASQLLCTLFTLFYTTKIRCVATQENGVVIRSVEAVEKLAEADYLFLLDGAVLTDGLLHFHSASCADGEIRDFSVPNQSARVLAELVSLYHDGATRTLTTGVGGGGIYLRGIEEFLSRSGVDRGALRIRCSIVSYSSGNMVDTPERLDYVDRGERLNLRVWRTSEAIRRCQTTLVGNRNEVLSEEGKQELERLLQKNEENRRTPLIVTQAAGNEDSLCFVGVLFLSEGMDETWEESVRRLERGGCRVIAFSRSGTDAPDIPTHFLENGCVSKQRFLQHGVPLTHRFGNIRAYRDFDDEDIKLLIRHAQKQGKHVMVIGFGESAIRTSPIANGLITCAPTHARISGYLDEEIQTVDRLGQPSAISCAQTVKQEADVLVSRPTGKRGGLSSVARTISQVKGIRGRLADYLRYLVCVQLIMVVAVSLPMLFGRAILDARHVLLLSEFFGLLGLLGALYDPPAVLPRRRRDMQPTKGIKAFLQKDRPVLISALGSSLIALILPEIFGFFAIGDRYYHRVEVLLCSLILVHLCALPLIKYGIELKSLKQALTDRFLILQAGLSLVFVTVCLVWEDFGNLFSVEEFPAFPYSLLIPIPAIVFCIVFMLFSIEPWKNQGGKQQKKNRKM